MIAVWMLYCVALGVLLAGAGLMLEQAVQTFRGATRRVWALALSGAVILPVVGIVLRDGSRGGATAEAGAAVSPLLAVMGSSVDVFAILDGTLVTAWAAASFLLVAAMLVVGVHTWRRHRTWGRVEVDGVPVLLSDEVGPAVVGFLQSRVVLPRWALRSDAGQRAVMLRHELEHLAGRDPQLLLFGLALLVAMPWNLPLWFMTHRLRLAVEVDCDRRVLRGGGVDPRAYGELLLTVGARRAVPALTVAGLARSRSLLEHRIDRMTLPRRPGAVRRSLLMAAASAMVVAAAWSLPQPVRASDFDLLHPPCTEPVTTSSGAQS